jgi:hypothetical protein
LSLSNAERQKRHRERLKAALARSAIPEGSCLTPEQIADRDAVMAEPLYPVPPRDRQNQIPTFMGWNRYEWSAAPEALINHFGMRTAWESWRAEKDEMQAQVSAGHARSVAHFEAVLAGLTPAARERAEDMMKGGSRGIFYVLDEIAKDPALGTGRKRKARVT